MAGTFASVPGAGVAEGHEIKVRGRWYTVTALFGGPENGRQAVETLDAQGRERVVVLDRAERYPVRRGAVPASQRYHAGECSALWNHWRTDFRHVMVLEDDGGPMVRVTWRAGTDDLGRGGKRQEQCADRRRLSRSEGTLRAELTA